MHNLYFPWIRIIIFFGIISGIIYSARFFEEPDFELREADFAELVDFHKEHVEIEYKVNGTNRKFGNLLASQPFFHPLDFYSEENYYKSLEPMLIRAKEEKILDSKSLMIFPEHVGSGLVLVGEKRPAYFSSNVKDAVRFLKTSRKLEIAEIVGKCDPTKCKEIDKEIGAILRLKKDLIAEIYNNTFSKLADDYSVSIIAGSIMLPSPSIVKGVLVAGDGAIENVSVVYLPNGKASTLIKKVHLNEWEKTIAVPGDLNQDFVVSVPAWKVAVLIGNDSFYESLYKKFYSTKIDGIVSPASGLGNIFHGLADSQVDGLQDQDVWIRYSIGKFIQQSRGKEAVQVFWKGVGWDLDPKGLTYTNREFDSISVAEDKPGPKLLNLYF
ncbi:hypothetical protein [Leptospira sp. GIMC2001]|uniref:hypothetical protein n=1 Tax=Leptospira sp. GIMC2001 TaxID=1513297 RepID=UPI00234A76D7|nr:hypothetical protein [Leptospira sp. GIMC2001]WCL49423.1 hypothetical protein O4O04_19360 [Leptospira sp. GIMC2001]